MRSRTARFLAVLGLSAALLSACGGEPANEESFRKAMIEQAEMTEAEADCMTTEMFVNSGLTEEDINTGASNPSESPAYEAAFENALSVCTNLR